MSFKSINSLAADKLELKAKMAAYYLNPVRCKICGKAIPFLASYKRKATLCGDQMSCRCEHIRRTREAKKQRRRQYYEKERLTAAGKKRPASSEDLCLAQAIRLARKIDRKRNKLNPGNSV